MVQNNILNYSSPNRIRLIKEDPNPEYVIQIISNALRISIPVLKQYLTIEIHSLKNTITLKSTNTTELASLFYRLINRGIKFESVTPMELRVDLAQFVKELS